MLCIRHLILSMMLVIFVLPHTSMAQNNSAEEKIRQAFENGELDGLHSALALYKGEIIAEVHFDGEDESWGAPLGKREHGPETLHDLRSVTKSITSLLYGIALADGMVPNVDRSIVRKFPQYMDLAMDPDRMGITIGNTLSMQMGTEWDESLSYTDPKNSEIAMELSDDRYRYVLSRPMVDKPGEKWNYNGGATALIARLIVQGTGDTVEVYAKEKLFTPLGITNYEWIKGSNGESSAASGLRMNIHDLAKIGQMINSGGEYNGKQIVPSEWLDASFTPRAKTASGLRYGYFWWLAPTGEPPLWIAGFGNGGQRLTVQPQHDIVIVIFAGNYNQPEYWKLGVKLIENYISPALIAEMKE